MGFARNKGLSFERKVANVLRAIGFPKAMRNLEYQSNNAYGVDLSNTGPFSIQCKKTKKYVPMSTIQEVKDQRPHIPVLIAAGDAQEALATIPLWAFAWLVEHSLSLEGDWEAYKKRIKGALNYAKG